MNGARLAALTVISFAVAACGATVTQPSPSAADSTADASPAAATAAGAIPAAATIPPCPGLGIASPGTYRIPATDTMTVAITMDVAAGWQGCGLLGKGSDATASILGFWDVGNVYEDPCHWKSGAFDPPVGPGVDELAGALDRQKITVATAATAASIDGAPATHLELTVPSDLDVSGCDGDEFRFIVGPDAPDPAVWYAPKALAPGLAAKVWIVEVDGHRMFIQAAHAAGATQATREEAVRMVKSVRFLP